MATCAFFRGLSQLVEVIRVWRRWKVSGIFRFWCGIRLDRQETSVKTHFSTLNTLTMQDRSYSSHSEMQRWLWSKKMDKNRNERKSAHGHLRCSSADNTHPTFEPWRRGDAWPRSGRLIPTKHDDSLVNERRRIFEQSSSQFEDNDWVGVRTTSKSKLTTQEDEKAKVGSHYSLAIFNWIAANKSSLRKAKTNN